MQAVFEGIRGRGYRGDIAIDDTVVKNGPCPPPGSCDFEKGLCAYQNDLSADDFDWERNTGHTTSIGTGPSVDHTTGTTKGNSSFYIKPLRNIHIIVSVPRMSFMVLAWREIWHYWDLDTKLTGWMDGYLENSHDLLVCWSTANPHVMKC